MPGVSVGTAASVLARVFVRLNTTKIGCSIVVW
jgi:hypothetical protein